MRNTLYYSFRKTFAYAIACATGAACVLGCSSSDGRPPAADLDTSPPSNTGTTASAPDASADAAADASADADAGADASADSTSCTSATLLGPAPLQELGVAGDAPVPVGGSIVPGTYILEEMYENVDSADTGPTGYFAQKNIALDGNNFVFVESEGTRSAMQPPVVTGGTYAVSGANLVLSPFCPSAAATRTLGYTALPPTLMFFYDDGRREVYRLEP